MQANAALTPYTEAIAMMLWGGATPDPNDEDKGVGITLWDFEANHPWEAAHDPGYDENAPATRGRFASVYGSLVEDNKEHMFAVSVFRDFVDESEAGATPVDLDYYFGRVEFDAETAVVFFDWQLSADVCDADLSCFDEDTVADQIELTGVQLAFIEGSAGRAEVNVSGGDLGADEVDAIECWDGDAMRTYLSFEFPGASIELGDVTDCGPVFQSTLAELGVPSLDSIDAEDLAALECVASYGVDAPECQ